MKVCILLSTYNGAKYLEEQLESLLKQKNVDVDILVRDDGSTDSTCDILDKWQSKGLLRWYSGPNKGFALSFMDLVQSSGDYDFYAFCDQDDIWLPNKLDVAIKSLSTLQNPNKLYCSNTFYYKDGKNLGLIKKFRPKSNIYTSLIQNIATGCTIVFNRNLKDVILDKIPEYIIAHDFWFYQIAVIFGEVFYDEDSYILYRQHANNQIGSKSGLYEKWKRRVISFFSSKKKDVRSLQAKELLKFYSGKIDTDKLRAISLVANYRDTISTRFTLFFDSRYTMGSMFNNILLRLRILAGKL